MSNVIILTPVEKIKINQEYKKLVPELSNDQYQSLKASIREHGFYREYPILLNDKGEVVDGHHRLRACLELGIDPYTVYKSFESKLHEKLFVSQINRARRHFNRFQTIEQLLKEENILEEIAAAERNQKTGVPLKKGEGLGKYGINQKIGELSNSGHDTVRKVKIILEMGSPEELHIARTKENMIADLYNNIMRRERLKRFLAKAASIKTNPIDQLYRLHNIDFRRIGFNDHDSDIIDYVKPNSVDLVFVDSLYYNVSLFTQGSVKACLSASKTRW